MVFLTLIFIGLGFSSTASFATPAAPSVIFITLDGVRTQEFFSHTEYLPRFKAYAQKNGFIFGERQGAHPRPMKISDSVALSLPGYRAILSGQFESTCLSNDCKQIDHETIFDRLAFEFSDRHSVAAFTSWNRMSRALESIPRHFVSSVGLGSIQGLSAEEQKPYLAIQERAFADEPTHWLECRYDRYTFEMGLKFLKEYQPRFLYLSFIDTDEWAHQKDYLAYVRALKDWDERFSELIKSLDEMGEYSQNTSIVVTTDHGRGLRKHWSNHNLLMPNAFKVWAVVIPSKEFTRIHHPVVLPREVYSHLQIRPTLELLLGLKPELADQTYFTQGQ